MNILVTGTEGYIGTVLADELIKKGHTVTGLDTGFFADAWLYDGLQRPEKLIKKDTRDITVEDLRGYDAMIHLAEISNDPMGVMNRDTTYDINHRGSLHVAKTAKEAGIKRFIFSSSCSVYGIATEDMVTETSATNPQTAYAECKRLIEQDVAKIADDNFSPVFLRNATVYGASPRLRFDLVLNNLCGLAWVKKEIAMTSDGSPWRPIVHVKDVCRAMICAVEAPREIVHNEIFNVGNSQGNYQVKTIAEIVADVFPGCKLTFGKLDGDTRSYKVSFDKIHSNLPGFSCAFDAKKGAEELRAIFERVHLSDEHFSSRHYTRLKQLQYLMGEHKIDDKFHWLTT